MRCIFGFTCLFVFYLWPHAVRDATEHQGAQALRAGQDRIDELPGQVAHRVVVGELQVGLPAQSLLGVFPLGGAFATQPGPGLPVV